MDQSTLGALLVLTFVAAFATAASVVSWAITAARWENKVAYMFSWKDRTLEDAVAEVVYKSFMVSLGLNPIYNEYTMGDGGEALFTQWGPDGSSSYKVRLWVEPISGCHTVRKLVLTRGTAPEFFCQNVDGKFEKDTSEVAT